MEAAAPAWAVARMIPSATATATQRPSCTTSRAKSDRPGGFVPYQGQASLCSKTLHQTQGSLPIYRGMIGIQVTRVCWLRVRGAGNAASPSLHHAAHWSCHDAARVSRRSARSVVGSRPSTASSASRCSWIAGASRVRSSRWVIRAGVHPSRRAISLGETVAGGTTYEVSLTPGRRMKQGQHCCVYVIFICWIEGRRCWIVQRCCADATALAGRAPRGPIRPAHEWSVSCMTEPS